MVILIILADNSQQHLLFVHWKGWNPILLNLKCYLRDITKSSSMERDRGNKRAHHKRHNDNNQMVYKIVQWNSTKRCYSKAKDERKTALNILKTNGSYIRLNLCRSSLMLPDIWPWLGALLSFSILCACGFIHCGFCSTCAVLSAKLFWPEL